MSSARFGVERCECSAVFGIEMRDVSAILTTQFKQLRLCYRSDCIVIEVTRVGEKYTLLFPKIGNIAQSEKGVFHTQIMYSK